MYAEADSPHPREGPAEASLLRMLLDDPAAAAWNRGATPRGWCTLWTVRPASVVVFSSRLRSMPNPGLDSGTAALRQKSRQRKRPMASGRRNRAIHMVSVCFAAEGGSGVAQRAPCAAASPAVKGRGITGPTVRSRLHALVDIENLT